MTGPSITTRGGDDGSTRLFSGVTVSKASARPAAFGAIEELVAALGLARCHCRAETGEEIVWLQRALFRVASELATTAGGLDRLPTRVDAAFLAELDARRDAVEAVLTMPTGFVLPGADPGSAHLEVARTLCRRAERHAVGLMESGDLTNPVVVKWLNRLSDHLWLMARREESQTTLVKEPPR
jgi:cob(I)alamin adenosyltransferase